MIKLIVGSRGTGKTKMLLDLVNDAAEVTKGNVVCIEQGDSLKFDLRSTIRLIDIEEYEISGPDAYYGFIAGLLAGNYDITQIFCDATYRIICGWDCKDADTLEDFILKVANLAKDADTEIVFTVSDEAELIPESIRKYVINQE